MWKKEELHISVLLQELVDSIGIKKSGKNIIVDCTLWMWWHAREIIKKLNKWDVFVWFDNDKRNLDIAKPKLEEEFSNSWINLFFINDNFENLKERLYEIWIKEISWIYYDLGISSLHVDEGERWFSFRLDWPLDMRFDTSTWITASEVVNSYNIDKLIHIFKEYWEEPLSKKIATEILEARKKWIKFRKTSELSDFIWKISNFPKTKTRIFQALRIEVNRELEVIEKSVMDAIDLLEKWWNIFIISFHSLEDRIVKTIFKKETKDCICTDLICKCNHKKKLKVLTKKPILPTHEEIKRNPRSRSAKARLAIKI
jgi:16S rRNA (cytosine1402-N4)-methyltransferase